MLFALPLIAIMSVGVNAAEPPPPPGIVEVFGCNYNDGKDNDDLMAARDYFVKQSEKAGVPTQPSYVWNLYKGGIPLDFVWFTAHESLAAFGANADAGFGKEELDLALERFNTVGSCQAGMMTIRDLFVREGAEADGGGAPTLVSSSACSFQPGADESDLRDLGDHIAGVLKGMGDEAPISVYGMRPITGGPNIRDVYVFNLNESASAWSGFIANLVTSEAGQRLGRHFDSVLDCDQSMWGAQRVIDPQEG